MSDRTQPLAAEDGMPVSGLRLIRVIVLETLAVALLGLFVFGILWDMGFFRAGLVAGAAIWVLVSPVIEIATVLRMRTGSQAPDEFSMPPREGPPAKDQH